MSAFVIHTWRLRSALSIILPLWDLDQDFEHLPLESDGDQDLCFFLRGGSSGSSFIFPSKGTFSSSEDLLELLELLDDDDLQTLVLSLVVQIISRRVICPFFCDWKHQDHFLILLPLL